MRDIIHVSKHIIMLYYTVQLVYLTVSATNCSLSLTSKFTCV